MLCYSGKCLYSCKSLRIYRKDFNNSYGFKNEYGYVCDENFDKLNEILYYLNNIFTNFDLKWNECDKLMSDIYPQNYNNVLMNILNDRKLYTLDEYKNKIVFIFCKLFYGKTNETFDDLNSEFVFECILEMIYYIAHAWIECRMPITHNVSYKMSISTKEFFDFVQEFEMVIRVAHNTYIEDLKLSGNYKFSLEENLLMKQNVQKLAQEYCTKYNDSNMETYDAAIKNKEYKILINLGKQSDECFAKSPIQYDEFNEMILPICQFAWKKIIESQSKRYL